MQLVYEWNIAISAGFFIVRLKVALKQNTTVQIMGSRWKRSFIFLLESYQKCFWLSLDERILLGNWDHQDLET